MEKEDRNEVLKYHIYLIGLYRAGGTSLLKRYFFNKFEDKDKYDFNQEFVYKKNIELDNGKKICIFFFDLRPNSFNIYAISPLYLRKADGFMLNYDKTCRETFQHLQYYLDYIKNSYNENIGKITLDLNGCKKDIIEK